MGVDRGDEAGRVSDFRLIDISGHQEGAGDQKRGLGSLVEPFSGMFEIGDRLLVANSGERHAQRCIPGL